MPLLAAIKDWFSWFPGDSVATGLKWFLVWALLVVGFIGTFLPILPGTTLIWAGSLVYYFAFGMEKSHLGWPSLVAITLLWIASIVVDMVSGALGAKKFGSSKWGIWGAIVGGLVGLAFGLPGIIIGPIAGVFVAEMALAKKELKPAANSTFGTVVGGLAGILGKVALALGMVAWFVADVFWLNPAE